MNTELVTYFTAEKNGAILLICMGITSLVASYLLWYSKSAFLAMLWPLLILGVFELIIGVGVAWRTPAQLNQLEAGFENDRSTTAAAELARMDRINRNFRIVKVVEGTLIVLGLLAVIVAAPVSPWYAIGLGVLIQSAALLVFDAFAHHRGEVYVQWLQSL